MSYRLVSHSVPICRNEKCAMFKVCNSTPTGKGFTPETMLAFYIHDFYYAIECVSFMTEEEQAAMAVELQAEAKEKA